ncbi:glycosyl-4,4'-diaponeurosporenoate acyltransferase CrtO family protein [Echinicola soli]|nr:hypothetical protein [Echinicola soli]
MIFNNILVKTEFYNSLSHLNFIENKTLNKYIGLFYFKWVVNNTFFKFFNQKIKIRNKNTVLADIRREMTIAEISHLIGFVFVTFIALYKSISVNPLFGLTIMFVNVFLNLYPSLLQQENKRRLDKLMKRKLTFGTR